MWLATWLVLGCNKFERAQAEAAQPKENGGNTLSKPVSGHAFVFQSSSEPRECCESNLRGLSFSYYQNTPLVHLEKRSDTSLLYTKMLRKKKLMCKYNRLSYKTNVQHFTCTSTIFF